MQPDYTRILIPFGRIFHGEFQSGLAKIFPDSLTCLDDPGGVKPLELGAAQYAIKIKVTEFQVWENPLNHSNLNATIESRVYRANLTNNPEFVYTAQKHATAQSIGPIMTTSAGVILHMNKISDEFAAELSGDIPKNLQRRLQ